MKGTHFAFLGDSRPHHRGFRGEGETSRGKTSPRKVTPAAPGGFRGKYVRELDPKKNSLCLLSIIGFSPAIFIIDHWRFCRTGLASAAPWWNWRLIMRDFMARSGQRVTARMSGIQSAAWTQSGGWNLTSTIRAAPT